MKHSVDVYVHVRVCSCLYIFIYMYMHTQFWYHEILKISEDIIVQSFKVFTSTKKKDKAEIWFRPSKYHVEPPKKIPIARTWEGQFLASSSKWQIFSTIFMYFSFMKCF